MEMNLIVRKPTDDEQRYGKIVTSDYMISAVTIHSSVLKTLGWVSKVYRAKKSTIVPSNKAEITKALKTITVLSKPKCKTFAHLFGILKEAENHPHFMDEMSNKGHLKWTDVNCEIPNFVIENKFKYPNALVRTVSRIKELKNYFENGVLEGLSDYQYDDTNKITSLLPSIHEYLDKIATNGVRGHTQTFLNNTVQKNYKKYANMLGDDFTPSDFANTLSSERLTIISDAWHINLKEFVGTWEDLCKYLYSPSMIAEIRNEIGVNVRSRSKDECRKGIETSDMKKFTRIIENKKAIIGNNFNIDEEKRKIEEAKKNVKLKEVQLEEARWCLNHAIKNNVENVHELSQAVEKIRGKYNYAVKALEKLESNLNKKKDALQVIKEYEIRQNLLNEMIEETRSGEEISMLEHEGLVEALRRQKNEKQIPYYTWRFVCDKIDKETASRIEEALEENLNKGNGVNGEDGYINVTAFPMTKSYEFFVDYPKNSNLFRAFKNRGIELSNILIDGVAKHLKMSFVSPRGEMFINNPMEKTLSGDMLEWVGL